MKLALALLLMELLRLPLLLLPLLRLPLLLLPLLRLPLLLLMLLLVLLCLRVWLRWMRLGTPILGGQRRKQQKGCQTARKFPPSRHMFVRLTQQTYNKQNFS